MASVYSNLDTERHCFTMYWNTGQYDDGTRYVFCDELEEYTFHPYSGKLKEIPEYSENCASFEDVRIFLVNWGTGKIVKVPCNIVEELKKIYIADGNFNKYWKEISKNICWGIRKRSSRDVTQASVNDRVDLSLLESPARMAKIGTAYTIEYKGKEIDIETQRLISKRASALDNHRIRFVYAKSDRIVHDKTCEQVEKIKYWDFGAAEELPDDRELCQHCKKRIYIRKAIKDDTKKFAWYLHFFEKGRVSSKLLEQFLNGGDVKLHMASIDELIVTSKEDTWRVRRKQQGIYELYHNNYVMVNAEERSITAGFHLQKTHFSYLPGILRYIESYDWQEHLKAKQLEPETEGVKADFECPLHPDEEAAEKTEEAGKKEDREDKKEETKSEEKVMEKRAFYIRIVERMMRIFAGRQK